MIGIGIGIPINNYKVASGGVAPSNSVAPFVSGLNIVGETLTTTDGTWLGSTPQELTRQFQRSTDAGVTWLNVGSYINEALNTWTALNASVGSGTTNPTFFSSNYKLTEDDANGTHYIGAPVGYMPTNDTYTFSVVAKAAEREWIYVYIYDDPEGSGKGAWFNITNGSIGTTESGITAQITNLGNGWFQCNVTRTVNGSALDGGGVALSTSDGVLTYTGTIGNGVFLTSAKIYTGNLSTYVPVSADIGNLIRSFVYSTNSIGVASSYSSNSISIVSMDLINLQSYDASKFTLSGSQITAWTEQDNTTQWTQSTGADRPTLTAGVPTFAGSGDSLVRASDVSATSYSLFFVCRNTSETTAKSLFASVTGTNWYDIGSSSYVGALKLAGVDVYRAAVGYKGKRDTIIGIVKNGNSITIYVNNRACVQTLNNFAGQGTLIGRLMSISGFASFGLAGTLKSVVMSSSVFSSTQIQDTINSLYDKYNLSSNTAIDTIIGFGDSNTVGQGAVSYLSGLSTQFGIGFANAGIAGSLFQTLNASSGYTRYSNQIVTKPYTDYIVIQYGTNDILASASFATYQTEFNIMMNDLVNVKGINPSKICICSIPYQRDNVNSATLDNYRTFLLAQSVTYGTKYFDLLQWMRDNGGNSLLSDNVHLNQTAQNGWQAGVYAALTS